MRICDFLRENKNRHNSITIYELKHKYIYICSAQSKNRYNSRIVLRKVGIAQQSENSHFAQDNSRIVPIPTLRRTYIYMNK